VLRDCIGGVKAGYPLLCRNERLTEIDYVERHVLKNWSGFTRYFAGVKFNILYISYFFLKVD